MSKTRQTLPWMGLFLVGWFWLGLTSEGWATACDDVLQESRRFEEASLHQKALTLLEERLSSCKQAKIAEKAADLAAYLQLYDQSINLMSFALRWARSAKEREAYQAKLERFRQFFVAAASRQLQTPSPPPAPAFRQGFRFLKKPLAASKAIQLRRQLEEKACRDLYSGFRAGFRVEATPKASCQASSALQTRILFALGKADLRPETSALLDSLALVLRPLLSSGARLLVLGHTDRVSSYEYNLALSQKRAASVRSALIQRGLEGSLLLTEGLSFEQPVSSNQTPEGRAQNRRVEFFILRRK